VRADFFELAVFIALASWELNTLHCGLCGRLPLRLLEWRKHTRRRSWCLGLIMRELICEIAIYVGVAWIYALKMLPHCLDFAAQHTIFLVTAACDIHLSSHALVLPTNCIAAILQRLDVFNGCIMLALTSCGNTQGSHTFGKDFPFAGFPTRRVRQYDV
jgi:hypothetical protein